jgi:hypothetical protein
MTTIEPNGDEGGELEDVPAHPTETVQPAEQPVPGTEPAPAAPETETADG